MNADAMAEAVLGAFTGEDRCMRCCEFAENWPVRAKDIRGFFVQVCPACFRVIKLKSNLLFDDHVSRGVVKAAKDGLVFYGTADFLSSSAFRDFCIHAYRFAR